MTTVFISSAILIGVVLLFGCIGETLTEKAGHLNLGIPGIMCAGTAGGVLGVKIYMMNASSPVGIWCVLISIFFSALFAGLFGLLYAVLTVTLRANQNVTGLAITIFGNGFASFFLDTVVQTNNTDVSSKLTYAGQNFFIELFPFADKLGWFGEIFLSHGFLTNEAVVIAAETRTSSPVRILRDTESLQHVGLKGLFPCGEGAGYAGGIVSAAVDGERCADAVKTWLDAQGKQTL